MIQNEANSGEAKENISQYGRIQQINKFQGTEQRIKMKIMHVMQQAIPKPEPPFLWHPKSPCLVPQKQSQTFHLLR